MYSSFFLCQGCQNQVGHNLGLYHDGPCRNLKDTDQFCRWERWRKDGDDDFGNMRMVKMSTPLPTINIMHQLFYYYNLAFQGSGNSAENLIGIWWHHWLVWKNIYAGQWPPIFSSCMWPEIYRIFSVSKVFQQRKYGALRLQPKDVWEAS